MAKLSLLKDISPLTQQFLYIFSLSKIINNLLLLFLYHFLDTTCWKGLFGRFSNFPWGPRKHICLLPTVKSATIPRHNFYARSVKDTVPTRYLFCISLVATGAWCENNISDIFKSWQMSKNTKQGSLIVTCDTCANVTLEKGLNNRGRDMIPFLLLNAEIEKVRNM